MEQPESRVLMVFAEAMEIADAKAREVYLSGVCGTDSLLRKEVEELLRAGAQAGDFLPDQPKDGLAAELRADMGLSSVPSDPERLGNRIDRYKLLQKIGEGGCGVVYMAEQEKPVRRKVALKVIKLGMDTRGVVARFEAERQALALMDHPNIAKVLDDGATENGRPYFVMELVRGRKITQYCDEQRFSTRQRLDLFVQVCQAVQHAHQKGVIHRDLKPSNILVTERDGAPVPKVIDFGIAKATGDLQLTDKTVFTAFEQFIGTPAYMSPEQARPGELDIDTRSDVYSLGVLLYELLTSKTPFDTKVLIAAGLDEMRRTIRAKQPVKPSTRLSTAPEGEVTSTAHCRGTERVKLIHLVRGDLDWIVMKCLEKERTRRYETANALATDIQRHLNNEPVVARPPSRLYEFQKTVRRHKLGFTAVASVITALSVGVVVSGWQAGRARKAEREQIHLRQAEQLARSMADTQRRISRQRAYASDMNLAQAALAGNDLRRLQVLLNQQKPGPNEEDLRGWEWRYLWQYCKGDAAQLCQTPSAVSSLAISQDGRWAAIGGDRDGKLSVWELRSRTEVAQLPAGSWEVAVAFSPTRALLAFSSAEELTPTNWHCSVHLWDAESRQMIGQELPLTGGCRGMGFTADGLSLFTCTTDDRITLWRLPEGVKLKTLVTKVQEGLNPPFAVGITPDGSVAAYAAPDGWLRLIDLENGSQRWRVKAADEFVWALAFSPDGKTIASGGAYLGSAIRLWDVASGTELGRSPQEARSGANALVFWPDGLKLASAAGQTIRLWDISRPTQVRPLGQPLCGQADIWRLALMPDGSTLVSGCKEGS